MINNGEIDEVIVVEENKNKHNKKFKPIIRYEYDIKIKKIVTKHADKEINIDNYPVIYGDNIKVIECLLNQRYMSLDGIKAFLYDATNNQLLTNKGSFYSRNKKEQLMNSLILNIDESPIKINGEQYYLHNISEGCMCYVSRIRNVILVKKRIGYFILPILFSSSKLSIKL